jgi:tetratricopeptide (TPR) repeat protein
MPTPINFLAQIRQLIADDKSEEAMALMRQLLDKSPALNELIMHSARHKRIMAAIRQGIVPLDEANMERNQINKALLELLGDIDTEIEHNSRAQKELSEFSEHYLDIKGNNNKTYQGIEHSQITDNSVTNIYNTPNTPPTPQKWLTLTQQPTHFIGRETEMEALRQQLQDGDKPLLLLNGVGGIGKSTIAKAYCHRYKEQYERIAWLNAERGIIDAFLDTNLIKQLGIEQYVKECLEAKMPNIEIVGNRVMNLLKNMGKGLLILDNAQWEKIDKPESEEDKARNRELNSFYQKIADLQGNWHIICTARAPIHSDFKTYPVGVLSLDNAVKMFCTYCFDKDEPPELSAEDSQILHNIINSIGCHTLVVEILAKIARAMSWQMAQLSKRLVDKGINIATTIAVQTTHSSEDIKNVKEYLTKLFDIAELNNEVKACLRQLAILPPEMPFELFAQLMNIDLNNDEKKDALRALLHNATMRGFLSHIREYNPAADHYIMHPILQEVIRDQHHPTPERHKILIYNLAQAIFDKQQKNPLHAAPLVPYGHAVARALYKTFDAQKPDAANYGEVAKLCNNLSGVYRAVGNYLLALDYQQKAIAIFEKVLDKDHPDLATSYNNLSGVYRDMGNLPLAMGYQQKAIAIQEKVLDKTHPDLATSYNILSQIYQDMGKLSLALGYQQKATAIREKVLDKAHPDLAKSYNNLSAIYQDMGNLPLAMEYQQKTIAIQEKELDKDHPDLAASYNNLSLIYQAMGKLPLAMDYQQKAIAIREKVLGKDHPDLAMSYNNLSLIYRAMGNLPLALDYQQKAIDIQEKVLDKDHPNLATSYNNLSAIYHAMGNLPLALAYQQKAIDIQEKVLDKDHPDLATSYHNLSGIYHAMGNLPLALDYQQKAIDIQEKVLGKDHLNLATSYNNLSQIYKAMGNLPLALGYQQKAIAIFEKVLDKDHPDLAASYYNLSFIYRAMGDIAQAATYIKEAVRIWQYNFPNGHPHLSDALQAQKIIRLIQLMQAGNKQLIMKDKEMRGWFMEWKNKGK